MDEINFYSRKDEYGWLSNFHRCPMKVGNKIYPTNENFYQSEKAKDQQIKEWIAKAPSPYLAMKAGRSLRPYEMVDEWETKKLDVMWKGLWHKFFYNDKLRQKLIDTGDALLQEDSPTDMFWGRLGKNHLGILLMKVRQECKKT